MLLSLRATSTEKHEPISICIFPPYSFHLEISNAAEKSAAEELSTPHLLHAYSEIRVGSASPAG